MLNKIKTLYRKIKKGFKKHESKKLTVIPRTGKEQEIGINLRKKLKEMPSLKASATKTKKPEKAKRNSSLRKSFKEKPTTATSAVKIEKEEKMSKIGSSFSKSFKKIKEKIKGLKIKRHKKKKIIGSKKLAALLTAATIVTLLPMFHLAPVPALAAATTCVFTINFIMIKSLKKFLKYRKSNSNIQDISVETTEKEKNL
ncbi:MAG: hypothetical protein QWI36_04635 [Wolbachia endosymbiont of Tyrophagus putrescentiae]|nr:hypothetical protein [Wolbachia endosymbiont of Tyrophagus putrescentiae]